MKYNQFVALKEKLEEDGSSLNEFVKEVTGKPLNEAEPMSGMDLGSSAGGDTTPAPKDEPSETESTKLDTKGGGGLSRLKPGYAIKRKKLINNAKKYIKMGQNQIIGKFLPKILKSQEHTAAAAVAASKEGKSPKEVLDSLKDSTKEARTIQSQQLEGLKKAIGQVGKNFETRVNSIIDKDEKLSEKEKLTLRTYWIMLSQQVQQKLFATIVKKQNEFIKKQVQDNPELEKVINSLSGAKNYALELDKLDAEIKKQKDEIKKAQKELEAEGGEKPAEGEHKLEAGQVYNVDVNNNGKTTEIEIVEVLEDGSIKVKAVGSGSEGTYKKGKHDKQIAKLTKDTLKAKEEEPKPEPEAATA